MVRLLSHGQGAYVHLIPLSSCKWYYWFYWGIFCAWFSCAYWGSKSAQTCDHTGDKHRFFSGAHCPHDTDAHWEKKMFSHSPRCHTGELRAYCHRTFVTGSLGRVHWNCQLLSCSLLPAHVLNMDSVKPLMFVWRCGLFSRSGGSLLSLWCCSHDASRAKAGPGKQTWRWHQTDQRYDEVAIFLPYCV